ncbi:MAG: PQQ-dependent sugar dehydrogenase [Thermoanaerobaculia bacterium]
MPPTQAPRRAALLLLGGAALLALGSVAAARLSRAEGPEPRALRSAAAAVTLVPVASGLGAITAITHAGDERLFVTVQNGLVRVLSAGSVLPAPFLDIASLVSCCGERGLLSVAFHPEHHVNRFFFVNYTNTAGDTVVARYQTLASDPNRADPATAITLLTIDQPFPNHNGGQLEFGPDGYLYIGMGDGGSANDPMCNAQRDETLLGKLLRIDVDQNVNSPPFYGIPSDNPFATPGGARDEIWARGLRNPWRFSFDRVTGDLWIGDVGQGDREEIDVAPGASRGGENYGWKMMEGTRCAGSSGCPAGVPSCNAAALVLPRYEYNHSEGCSVTGGYVYRGTLVPALSGRYVYGDYCSGRLWANGERLTPVAPQLSTFGEDAAGELYAGTQDGRVQRFFDPSAPTATPTPAVTPERIVVPAPHRSLTPRALDRNE